MFYDNKLINVPLPSGEANQAAIDALDKKVRILDAVYGEDISALKAVYSIDNEVYIASNINTSIPDRMLGITTIAANSGNTGKVQIAGVLEDLSWNWVNGAIYLGLDGTLTQTPPIIGFNCQLGVAVSSTKIVVGIKNSVLIA